MTVKVHVEETVFRKAYWVWATCVEAACKRLGRELGKAGEAYGQRAQDRVGSFRGGGQEKV